MDVSNQLVDACKEGNKDAFEELVRLTHKNVFSLALRIVGNRDDAADITQEVYLKLLRKIRTFRGDAQFSTWLYRVTSNVAISYIRKQSRGRKDISLESPGTAEMAEEPGLAHADIEDEKQRLHAALMTLHFNYRAVVVMKDIYGFSLDEVGNRLGITEGAAKVRLFRARKRLKDILQEDRPETGTG